MEAGTGTEPVYTDLQRNKKYKILILSIIFEKLYDVYINVQIRVL